MTMFRVFSLGVLLSAAVTASSPAQIRPVPPSMGMQPEQAGGITVSATANERLPATSARVRLQLSTRNGALTLDAQSVSPIVDALVQAGADRSSVVLPLQFQSPGKFNNAQISATVQNPTAESIQRGIVTVGTAIANLPGVLLNGAQVELRRNDCSDVEGRARKAAIDQAREKALATAQQLNVKLGRVIGVRVNDQQSQDGSCSYTYSVGPYVQPQLLGAQDYVTINVYSSVTITYAIR